MKKQLVIIGIIVILVCVGLSGCELFEEKPDYITVNVQAHISVQFLDANGFVIDYRNPPPSLKDYAVPVRIEMIKAGGERLISDKVVVNQFLYVSGTFKVYKEQPVECLATASGYQDYYQQGNSYAQLNWATIRAGADYGGTYNWNPELIIYMSNVTHP